MNRIQKSISIALIGVVTLVGCVPPTIARLSPYQQSMKEQTVIKLMHEATDVLRIGTPQSLERAQNILELARDLMPLDPRIYDGLGCVEWRRKNYRLAEHFFKRAVEVNPEYDRGYVHLALVAERAGDTKSAEELLRRAIKLNPMNFRARNNYASILLEKGLTKAALQQLLRGYEASGDDVVLLYNLNKAASSISSD